MPTPPEPPPAPSPETPPVPPHLPLPSLFRAAGFDLRDGPPSDELIGEVNRFHGLVSGGNSMQAVVDWLRNHKRALDAEQACGQAAEAAEQLQAILELLEKNAVLLHLDGLDLADPEDPRALCRIGGDLRLVSLHPDVNPEELQGLEPWECVRLAKGGSDEMFVVGTYSNPGLRDGSLGSVVEFRGHLDPERGLVRVSRAGDDEQVVRLSRELRNVTLAPSAKLVLLRDDPRWAIAVLPADRVESRFEVPVDRIPTRLEDLAGLDPILEPLVKDIVLRVVRTDLRHDFDLQPLNGVIIYSYQPGTGKTSLIRAVARWLGELGEERDFDVALHVVPPNALKNKYHGEDARNVRDELCGSIRAARARPRTRPLFVLIVLDEIDSLGRRVGGDDVTGQHSPAQNDIVQALLHEMDGMIKEEPEDGQPPVHVLWVGLTNRPDMIDPALKRPGRFDLLLEVPPATIAGAESILSVYARPEQLPWAVGEDIVRGVDESEIRTRFLRPALRAVFDRVVIHYSTDGRQKVPVTAGELLTGASYEHAVSVAKEKAATRQLLGGGVPALTLEDILEGLLEEAANQARNMEADRQMLARQLRLKVPVAQVEIVPVEELADHRFVRLESA